MVKDNTYYQILEIEPNANEEDIKKAYRKQALKFHPDKHGGSEDLFKQLKEAYNVLSDPRKRRVYDLYGKKTLNTLITYKFNLDLVLIIPSMFFLFSLIIMLLISAIIVFCSIDTSERFNFIYVSIPIWLIDGIIVFWLFRIKENKIRYGLLVYFSLHIITHVLTLLVLNAQDYEWLAFIPIFLIEIIHLINNIDSFKKELETAENKNYFLMIMDNFYVRMIFVLQEVFLLLKIINVVDWSYWFVFTPAFFLILNVIVSFIVIYSHTKKQEQAIENPRALIITGVVILGIIALFYYTSLVLFILKLQNATFALALAFIPLFIVLGLFLCCCGCCLPIMFKAFVYSEEDPIIDIRKRISYNV